MSIDALLIRPSAAREIAAGTTAALQGQARPTAPNPRVLNLPGGVAREPGFEARSPWVYRVGSVAVIQVDGPMWYSISPWCAYYGGGSIAGLIHSLGRCAADDSVTGIVLDIHTPGGEANALADMADALRRARAVKPLWARVYQGFSMGYAAACLADEISMSPGTMVGSIGSIVFMYDNSEHLKQMGIRVVVASTGREKKKWADGQEIGDEALASMQRMVDRCGGDFFRLVHEGRGIPVEKIESWEGGEFFAEEALGHGLIDTVETEHAFYERVIAGATPTRRAGNTNQTGRPVAAGHTAGEARSTKGARMGAEKKPAAQNKSAKDLAAAIESKKTDLKIDDDAVKAIKAMADDEEDKAGNASGAPAPGTAPPAAPAATTTPTPAGPKASMEKLEEIVPGKLKDRDTVILSMYRKGVTEDQARAEVQSAVLEQLNALQVENTNQQAADRETRGLPQGRKPVPGANQRGATGGNVDAEWDATVNEVMSSKKVDRPQAVRMVRAERPDLLKRFLAAANTPRGED